MHLELELSGEDPGRLPPLPERVESITALSVVSETGPVNLYAPEARAPSGVQAEVSEPDKPGEGKGAEAKPSLAAASIKPGFLSKLLGAVRTMLGRPLWVPESEGVATAVRIEPAPVEVVRVLEGEVPAIEISSAPSTTLTPIEATPSWKRAFIANAAAKNTNAALKVTLASAAKSSDSTKSVA
jgi:hypothetical protein